MLKIVYQSRFKKDAKRYANNKKALQTIELLQIDGPLSVTVNIH
ncbi:hypothetical protein [Photorhabdus stackebrandtii]